MLSQHESEILNDLDQRLSFLSGSVLRSALRVANFQIKKIVKHKTVKANDKNRRFGVFMTPLSRKI